MALLAEAFATLTGGAVALVHIERVMRMMMMMKISGRYSMRCFTTGGWWPPRRGAG
jgi:hypothetical protein